MKSYVLFCGCDNTDLVPDSDKAALLKDLRTSGVNVNIVADLCDTAAAHPEQLELLSKADELLIIACYPRAVRWILDRAGVSLDGVKVTYCNMREQDVNEILREVLTGAVQLPGKILADLKSERSTDSWRPWYPVIDYDRCSSCRQCMNFCLFGVYEAEESGRVVVTNPSHCKDNCPACARICPDAAIIFPKHNEAPINGAEISDENAVKAAIKVNVDEILGDDVYAALAERRKKARKRIIKKKELEQAEKEREQCRKKENGE